MTRDLFPKNLTNEEIVELSNLEDFIGTKLYFYGSIMRGDYLRHISDIDFCVFTENTYAMKQKIQLFFQLPDESFKNIIRQDESQLAYGTKIKCKKYIDRNYEISIYEEKFKDTVLKDHNKGIILSPLNIIFHIVLKILYYFHILNKKMYYNLKNGFYNKNKRNHMFVVI